MPPKFGSALSLSLVTFGGLRCTTSRWTMSLATTGLDSWDWGSDGQVVYWTLLKKARPWWSVWHILCVTYCLKNYVSFLGSDESHNDLWWSPGRENDFLPHRELSNGHSHTDRTCQKSTHNYRCAKLRGMKFSHFSGCSAVHLGHLGFSHGFHAQLHDHSVESGSSPPVQCLGASWSYQEFPNNRIVNSRFLSYFVSL